MDGLRQDGGEFERVVDLADDGAERDQAGSGIDVGTVTLAAGGREHGGHRPGGILAGPGAVAPLEQASLVREMRAFRRIAYGLPLDE